MDSHLVLWAVFGAVVLIVLSPVLKVFTRIFRTGLRLVLAVLSLVVCAITLVIWWAYAHPDQAVEYFRSLLPAGGVG